MVREARAERVEKEISLEKRSCSSCSLLQPHLKTQTRFLN